MKHYLRTFFKYTPALAIELSPGALSALILTGSMWWFLITRKFFLRHKPMTFNFFYNDKNFRLPLETPIDIAVLTEIFVLKEYEWKPNLSVRTILDLGAHWGDSALYYALNYPESKVYAVEPTPHAFSRLKKNAEIVSNIFPIQGALGNTTGSIKLYVSESSLGNSLTRRSITDKEILVETFSLKDLCMLAGVDKFDLIKFDIEGAERVLFLDKENLNLASAFIGEIHYDLMNLTSNDVKLYFDGWAFEESRLNDSRSIITAETA